MNTSASRNMRHAGLVSIALSALLAACGARYAPPAQMLASPSHSTEAVVPMHARGTFEVQITPLPADEYGDEVSTGRMGITKQLSGDITGTGKGQMITGMGTVKSSAAYSAIERITGTVGGRTGSFILQHTGIMHDGAQELTITIVPTSGSGDLIGIAGTFAIIMDGKQHRYDMTYTLPPAH